MKRSVSLVLLALFILAFCACNSSHNNMPQDTTKPLSTTEPTAPQDTAEPQDTTAPPYRVDTDKIFGRNPPLTLTYENEEIELGGASLEWKYFDEKTGLWCMVIPDRISMLYAKDRVRSIPIGDELTVYMEWEASPDEIIISCRNGDAWGKSSSPSELIRVNSNGGYSFTLKDGYFIYEIVATWSRFENWNGSAEYWFYTVKE